jgi:tetratricopeptide (TPR) repeat protein
MILIVVSAIGLGTGVTKAKLVAHWGLDGNVNDSIGSSHGTVVGDPSWEPGRFGRALLFGGDDYIMFPNESDFDITGEITVAAWIKVNAFDKEWQSIITKGDNSWRLARNGTGNNVAFHCSGLTIENSQWGVESNANVNDRWWHHIAGVYDGARIYLYVDGVLDKSAKASGKIGKGDYKVHIGANAEKTKREWNGLIDDVAIFDHALNEQQVAQLCRLGALSFTSEPTLLMLFNAVQRAERLVDEQKAQEAINIINNAIAQYQQWKQQNPNDITLGHKVLSCDLHFLSAKAQEAVGAPKADVADTYKRAVESGILSAPRQGPALLWLYENTDVASYDSVIEPFIATDTIYLKEVAAQAEAMVREQKSKAAVGFLVGNLAAYARWREKHPFDEVIAEDMLPEVHFQLAKAREAAGAPKKDIADVYSNTFSRSRFDYVPGRAAALIWLVENERTDECAKAIRLFTQSRDIRDCFKNAVAKVCEHFESQRNWAQFQWFLDALFTEAEYPYDWVVFVESCLRDRTSRWTQAYYAYLDGRSKLKFGRDCIIAEKYATEEKFMEAAELYQDIVNRCGPEDDKGSFECQLCKCLFYGGKYREAVAKLGPFIVNNKATHRSLVKEAMLMKGRAHVQLGEIDKAVDAFFAVMIEYPETKEAPETNFFVGYCYMLQSKFDKAKEAFNLVTQEHPESSYAGKARMCLIRIEDMTQ